MSDKLLSVTIFVIFITHATNSYYTNKIMSDMLKDKMLSKHVSDILQGKNFEQTDVGRVKRTTQ